MYTIMYPSSKISRTKEAIRGFFLSSDGNEKKGEAGPEMVFALHRMLILVFKAYLNFECENTPLSNFTEGGHQSCAAMTSGNFLMGCSGMLPVIFPTI
jgi:hypothetical protein